MFISLALLLILSPLILLISYLIYKREGGPVIFREPRMGRNKRVFTMYTFRIKTPPRQMIQALPPHPKPGHWRYGVPNDFHFSRGQSFYTEIGLTLKKSYLHKLPQLFNVLKGDMSLVGPRPEDVGIADYYNRHQSNRLKVRPGMTGYAQLVLNETAGYHKVIKADLHYVSQLSILFDLKIIYKTFKRKNV